MFFPSHARRLLAPGDAEAQKSRKLRGSYLLTRATHVLPSCYCARAEVIWRRVGNFDTSTFSHSLGHDQPPTDRGQSISSTPETGLKTRSQPSTPFRTDTPRRLQGS